jgi:hypothetical protein
VHITGLRKRHKISIANRVLKVNWRPCGSSDGNVSKSRPGLGFTAEHWGGVESTTRLSTLKRSRSTGRLTASQDLDVPRVPTMHPEKQKLAPPSSGHSDDRGARRWLEVHHQLPKLQTYLYLPKIFKADIIIVASTTGIYRLPPITRHLRRSATSHLQIIWVDPDVCRLLSDNLGYWQCNVGLKPRILSINLGRKTRCLQVGRSMFAGSYR